MLLEDALSPSVQKPETRPEPKRAPVGHKLQAFVAEQPVRTPSSSTPSTVGSTSTSPSQAEALGDAYSRPSVATSGWDEMFRIGLPEEEEPKAETEDTRPETKEVTYDSRRTKKMSWDDYLDLNRREKAAVDFNTLLIQAREKDLNLQHNYDPNDTQRKAYNKVVENLFGEDGGSATFAPETVALLNDVGFKPSEAKRFDDLDDFLGLKAAFTPQDYDLLGKLKADTHLTGESTAPGTDGPMDLTLGGLAPAPALPSETTTDAATLLAAGTRDLQEAMTRGRQVLENWKVIGAGALNQSVGFYGGIQNQLASPDIRLGQKDDDYFQLAFDALADASNDPVVLDKIKYDLGDGDKYRRFLAYADTKSRYSMDHNVGLGPGDSGVVYRSPEQFRQLLGLMEGGDSGATDGR